MQKRDFWGVSRLTMCIVTFSLFFTGCEKYYYLTDGDVAPACVLKSFNCVVDGDLSNLVIGSITKGNNDIYTETSNWGIVKHRKGYSSTFTINGIECTRNSDYSDSWSAEYEVGYNHNERFFAVIDNGKPISINKRIEDYNFQRFEDHLISEIVFEKGNLISYRYTEKRSNAPFTTLLDVEYTFEYDMARVYNNKHFPVNDVFSICYRPVLGQEYSFGERFDPQPFSKNLVVRKRNIDRNKIVFENTYKFDSNGLITELFQQFLYGGYEVNSLKWSYFYNCD